MKERQGFYLINLAVLPEKEESQIGSPFQRNGLKKWELQRIIERCFYHLMDKKLQFKSCSLYKLNSPGITPGLLHLYRGYLLFFLTHTNNITFVNQCQYIISKNLTLISFFVQSIRLDQITF